MLAGSLAARPAPPAFFAFTSGTAGSGWTPLMLQANALEQHVALSSRWPDKRTCVTGLQVGHFVPHSSGSITKLSVALPGVEEALVSWLAEDGRMPEGCGA
jgi:hypothetical protein